MSKRTDVHSPTNLVTEDYEYWSSGYYGTHGEPGYSPLATEAGEALLQEGWRFGENESAGDCYHCGAHLKYFAILKHIPSHTLVRVGEICLDNRFGRATEDFQRLRKQAKLDRERQRIKKARNLWFAVNPDREVAYQWCKERVEQGDYGWNEMYYSFIQKVKNYGDTTDKFVKTIMRSMARTERIEEEREARKREEAETAAPVIEGKIKVTGKLLTMKWKDNAFGGAMKMLVRDDRGFKIWGTCPKAILADIPENWRDQGIRVSFTATVEKSSDDETFGFFQRPSNAQVIKQEQMTLPDK